MSTSRVEGQGPDGLPAAETYDRPMEPQFNNIKTLGLPSVDLRALELTQNPDDNLLCPICHSLLISPVNLPCEHIFCAECIADALKHQPSRSKACPSCRTPTAESFITAAPKIISRILDDLPVRCPLAPSGCVVLPPRAGVEDHLRYYCDYMLVDCPDDACEMQVQRRLADRSCLHRQLVCDTCGKTTSELDRLRHLRLSCSEPPEQCAACQEIFAASELPAHLSECMDEIVPCTASKYGCDATLRRVDLETHENLCPLVKMGPFLERQKARLDEHERALRHLKLKSEVYEEGLTNVQETLRDSLEDSAAFAQSSGMTAGAPPFESQAAHLLDLHEALQNEVRRISTAVSDLDAKLEVSVLNQTLRANEEKLHRDAMDGHVRKQLQWLVSAKLQGQQRAAAVIKKGSSMAGAGSSTTSSNPTMGRPSMPPSAASELWGASSTPIRRLSDSSRGETKL